MLFQNKKIKTSFNPQSALMQSAEDMIKEQKQPQVKPQVAPAPQVTPAQLQKTGARTPDSTINKSFSLASQMIQPVKQPMVNAGVSGRINPAVQAGFNNNADAERVNRARDQLIANQGQVPTAPDGPRVAAPRNGTTPFSGTVNQNDLVKNFDMTGGLPPPKFDTVKKDLSEDEMIQSVIKDLLTNDPTQNAAAREAFKGDLAQKSAENLLATRGRMGVAGMGLTGAGASMEAGVQRADSRKDALALEDRDKALREEALKRVLSGAGLRDQERVGSIREGDFGLRERAADREDRMAQTAENMLEAELGEDLNNDGKIGKKTPDAFKQDKEQKVVDERVAATNADPNNPMSDKNMMDFARETGGNVQQVKAWADAQGKPLTMEVLNKVKAKFQDYVSRRSDKSKKVDFGEWFKADLAVYGGGWNPASNLWGIL
jgi:hypothetical protein